MGAKILNASMALTGFSVAVGLMAMFLPMHVLWFSVGVPLFSVDTKVLTVAIDCVTPMPQKVCDVFEGNPTLEEFAQHSCAPVVKGTVQNLCEGFQSAYVVGLMLVIVFVMNLMLQGAAVFSYNYYMGSSMRKKYRTLGVLLQSIGVFCVVSVLFIYYAVVIVYLNGVKPGGVAAGVALVGASHGAHASLGYIFMWVSCFLQVGSVMLSALGARSSQEELVEEAREQARFAAELGGMEMTGAYGQQGMQPQMQPQMQPYPGTQPQMQPQMGMGGFQQQGFQQQGFQQQGFQQPGFR